MLKRTTVIACGLFLGLSCQTPEPDVVDVFLGATKEDDLATLASVSVVGFPGEIESWRVSRVAASQVEPPSSCQSSRPVSTS